MLVTQMAVIHATGMSLASTFDQVYSQQMFEKLARTFTSQVETLKRHRTGGEQKVTVQQRFRRRRRPGHRRQRYPNGERERTAPSGFDACANP